MNLNEQICDWENIRLAYKKASLGKRGRGATAAFEFLLADNLLELEQELTERTYRPGPYTNFYIHEPKKRFISAAPIPIPSPRAFPFLVLRSFGTIGESNSARYLLTAVNYSV